VREVVELRRATSGDARAIRERTRGAYARWVPVIGREPKPMAADYAEAVRNHLIDLLCVGGELAALIETIPEADHLLIENVAVSPGFQHRGHGRRLIAHAEGLAVSLGYREARLYTNRLFAENVRLSLKLGYRVDREGAFKGRGVVAHMQMNGRPANVANLLAIRWWHTAAAVMLAPGASIHALQESKEGVDARDTHGHDDVGHSRR